MADDEKNEESHFDRQKKYKGLVAGGMSDKKAVEEVWPTTKTGIAKNAKERADKETAAAAGQ